MALQGVNLPLAFTGQEAIWQKVFKVKCYSHACVCLDKAWFKKNEFSSLRILIEPKICS